MPIENYKHTVAERLMRYVQIDTTADPNSESFPSTEIQKNLGKLLVEELKELGINDAEMDEWGYVFGTVKSNVDKDSIPTVCFCAHMDTAPDVTGKDVKPILHKNYDGNPITLPDDESQVITVEQHPYLKEKIGDDLITASGKTLLGADDKAGVACIMDFVQYLKENPSVEHGDIRILFTPDEEVGRGVDHLDMEKLNADYGYTLDGGVLGSIEDESFSADSVKITVHGVSAHPGYAKGKLINALKIGGEILAALPKDSWSPETTEGREGFVHPVAFGGIQEKATLTFIIRDHNTKQLAEYEKRLENTVKNIVHKYAGARYEFEINEQYRNMKEILKDVPFVTDYAIQAMKEVGITPRPVIIRGGTDGSRLSFMGLPCPNLFTGEMAIHSKHEYVSVQDMEKAVKTMGALVEIWAKHQ
ncbi:MAG: peptidase T [Fluviicola sp.]|nr:MAG: peptidase T [Fluviicola sp.]